jgi:hypothetical protein
MHPYEIRPSKDHRGGYAKHYSRWDNALIRVYDETGNLIETHAHKGDFKEL